MRKRRHWCCFWFFDVSLIWIRVKGATFLEQAGKQKIRTFDCVRVFDKYFRVLELPAGADDRQIKAAYRRLAKRYHPDISGDPATRGRFIDINEAYEILMNRDAYVRDAILRYQAKVNQRRHYKKYGSSRRPQDESGVASGNEARQRAETYADMKFKKFEKTLVYRTAVVVNSVFDYVVFGIGILMIASPFIGYFGSDDELLPAGKERHFQFLPIILGVGFLYGMWYFLIKNRNA